MAHAKTIMIQGTTSDAGKSTVVAALCRWFADQGVRVCPFKPQNMALNSAVTEDGGEIGRAQAVQAQAAYLEPHTDMNPVLLKPSSDTKAQVIIHGKAVTDLDAVDYHQYKTIAMQAVLESHERLKNQYDLILVEGAGSPAEINLRDRDIANMGFAEAVDCPVIIVADIDKGGVFAHLVGTLSLLSQSEQDRVVGFVINRFRGDISLLQSGLDWLEEKTGKPVLAVIPYLHGLHIDAEDAISVNTKADNDEPFRVVVPALPRVSNHTDFDALRLHPQVEFTFVGPDYHKPPADLVVLPGSKNVRQDLHFLKQQGWLPYLQKHLRYGGKLLGICGGLQMLGTHIDDPLGIEDEPGTSQGLGYLSYRTELKSSKQLVNTTGLLWDWKTPVTGYKIHAGITQGVALNRPFAMVNGQRDGALSEDNQIAATYLHGAFDHLDACARILQWAGVEKVVEYDHNQRRSDDLQRLADSVGDVIDWEKWQRVFGAYNAE